MSPAATPLARIPVGVVVVVVPPERRPLAQAASSAAVMSDIVTDVFGISVLRWLHLVRSAWGGPRPEQEPDRHSRREAVALLSRLRRGPEIHET